MTIPYYPPIPGVAGTRGRPSREEMEKRRVYWEANGGAPKTETKASSTQASTAPAGSSERMSEILGHLTQAVKNPPLPQKPEASLRAQPKMNPPRPQGIAMDVQAMVQDIVKSSVTLSPEEELAASEILVNLPPRRQGRPSKADVDIRLDVERKIKDLVVAKIQSHQKSAAVEAGIVDPMPAKKKSNKPIAPVLPSGMYPQYKFGDAVRIIIDGQDDRKGIVHRHDINSMWVFVAWKDGGKDWRHVTCLNGFQPSSPEEVMTTEVEVLPAESGEEQAEATMNDSTGDELVDAAE